MIVDEPGAAAWNMAVDDALLQLGGEPTLRLYGWSPHAVSIGYFQSWDDFRDLPASVPVVRRSTGGGAIHHGDEITFSLAVDADVLPRDVAASYCLLHDAAIAALGDVGVTGCRRADGANASPRPADAWCFRSPCRDDVVTDAGKLLGSAQRRIAHPRARILHHGSLVIERPLLTPFVAATADHGCRGAAAVARLQQALIARLADALALESERGSLTPAERSLAMELSETRYGADAFLRRR